MCGTLAYANASRFAEAPYFPLTGPFKFSVGLHRTDSFESYNFLYKLEFDKPTDPTYVLHGTMEDIFWLAVSAQRYYVQLKHKRTAISPPRIMTVHGFSLYQSVKHGSMGHIRIGFEGGGMNSPDCWYAARGRSPSPDNSCFVIRTSSQAMPLKRPPRVALRGKVTLISSATQ